MSPKNRNFTSRICRTRAAAHRHQHDKIWNAMRMLGTFTVDQVVTVVETSTARTIGTYISLLKRTGFVRRWPGNAPASKAAQYQLVRNSGPKAPSIVHRRTAIYDHNTDMEYALK